MMLTSRLYSRVGGVRLLTGLRLRVSLTVMARALAVLTACMLVSIAAPAFADAIANSVAELSPKKPAKVRTAAVLALGNMIDAKTADDARALAFSSLDQAATTDHDVKVQQTATNIVGKIASYRKSSKSSGTSGSKVAVFVNVDKAIDQSKKAPQDVSDRLARIVRKGVEKTGYTTSWPAGGLPTQKDLASNKTQGYIVASTVKKIDITKGGKQVTIACTVAVRVAPWGGKDGGEKWEANRAASASGSAKAMTGPSSSEISNGMRDCVEAVAEDVTNRQVVPFLKRVAQAGP